MYRCDNCGSGYSMRMASSWESCPRCMAKEKIDVPLSFELGWANVGRSKQGDAKAQTAPTVLPLGSDRKAAIG